MLFTIVFTKKAEQTFEAIGNQILDRWGEKERNVFRMRVYEVMDNISKFPFIFKAVDGSGNVRKGLVHRNCSVFYEIKNMSIEILFFWDNRQEPIL